MTERDQKELGKILWSIADTLRGAMTADDFRVGPPWMAVVAAQDDGRDSFS